MLPRLTYNLFIFITMITMPWQSYMFFIIAGFFIFENFYEGIVWGVVIDSVYGVGRYHSFGISSLWNYYFFTTVMILVYPSVTWVKKYLTWYD